MCQEQDTGDLYITGTCQNGKICFGLRPGNAISITVNNQDNLAQKSLSGTFDLSFLKGIYDDACSSGTACADFSVDGTGNGASKNDDSWNGLAGGAGTSTSSEEDSELADSCAGAGGAMSLGWIVCPILAVVSESASGVYEDYVAPELQVDPMLFEGDDGAKSAWGTFRTFANIAFIILFLVVIFSQLTGVGIDNYGIKKILPKMIVTAILINLSYWICLIAIDLSDILGNGFQALFNNLPTGDVSAELIVNEQKVNLGSGEIVESGGAGGSTPPAGGAGATPPAGGGAAPDTLFPDDASKAGVRGLKVLGLAGGAAALAVIAINPATLLSLLVTAVGALVSVFFLYLLLAAREAAILVLTVISPLAFACMLLPNTKKMFEKWVNFSKGLLLVYPTCGLLVGGGNFASKLVLSAGGNPLEFRYMLVGIIISVVPLFFIPSVIKNAFAAMGKVGAKIAGFGATASKATKSGIKNRELYKNAQQAGAERRTRIAAGLDRNGNPGGAFRRAVGNVMSGGTRGRQFNALRYRKVLSDRGSREAADGKDFMLATQTANEASNIQASGEINDLNKLGDGLRDALKKNDRAKINAYSDALATHGEDGREKLKDVYNDAVGNGMSETALSALRDNITSKHAKEYKDNNRSLFEAIKNGQTTTSYLNGEGKANLARKVTQDTIGAMDDNAFGEVFGSGGQLPDGLTDDEMRAVGEAAYYALQNSTNLKAGRRAALQNLVNSSGYSAPVQTVAIQNASSQAGSDSDASGDGSGAPDSQSGGGNGNGAPASQTGGGTGSGAPASQTGGGTGSGAPASQTGGGTGSGAPASQTGGGTGSGAPAFQTGGGGAPAVPVTQNYNLGGGTSYQSGNNTQKVVVRNSGAPVGGGSYSGGGGSSSEQHTQRPTISFQQGGGLADSYNKAQEPAGGNAGGSGAPDLSAMSTETLYDLATNPNARLDDPHRQAAEAEVYRRMPGERGKKSAPAPAPAHNNVGKSQKQNNNSSVDFSASSSGEETLTIHHNG